MKNALVPVLMDPELQGLIKGAAQETHLSQAAVMRAALRIGLPEVVKRHKTSPNFNRLVNLEPWDRKTLAKAYSNQKVDGDYAGQASMAAQSFPKD
jgi:hypothetical protein